MNVLISPSWPSSSGLAHVDLPHSSLVVLLFPLGGRGEYSAAICLTTSSLSWALMPISDAVKSAIKKNNPEMTHLSLSNTGLYDSDIDELCILLKDNPYITSLDLSHNNIGIKSASYFATILSRITRLDLQSNNLDTSAVISLLPVTPSALKQLDVTNNNLNDGHLDDLLGAIATSGCKLKFVKNKFSKDPQRKVAETVSKIVSPEAKGETVSPHVKLSILPPPPVKARAASSAKQSSSKNRMVVLS